MRKLSVVMVALAFACNANAQQFDGTWTGQSERFSLTLTVSGAKARLVVNCYHGYSGSADFALGTDGAVNTYLNILAPGGRIHITGTVQAINVPGGPCGGGTVKMTKKS